MENQQTNLSEPAAAATATKLMPHSHVPLQLYIRKASLDILLDAGESLPVAPKTMIGKDSRTLEGRFLSARSRAHGTHHNRPEGHGQGRPGEHMLPGVPARPPSG